MSHYDAIELFGVPIERRLTYTTATNKAWIIPTRHKTMKRCKRWIQQLKSRQPDIRQFFAKKKNRLNDTMEMAESLGSLEEVANWEEEGDEEEEESHICDAIKQQQPRMQTPGPCTRDH
jgi:hypothetical protein